MATRHKGWRARMIRMGLGTSEGRGAMMGRMLRTSSLLSLFYQKVTDGFPTNNLLIQCQVVSHILKDGDGRGRKYFSLLLSKASSID